jgi:hypothetical protein
LTLVQPTNVQAPRNPVLVAGAVVLVLVAAVLIALQRGWLATDPAADSGGGANKFVGVWRVHGSTVEYKADGTGTESWNDGPCNFTQMCTAYTNLTWRNSGSDAIVVTYTSLDIRDETGAPPFDSGRAFEIVGTTYTATYVSPGFLTRTADNEDFQFGNHYLCGDAASAENRTDCNA